MGQTAGIKEYVEDVKAGRAAPLPQSKSVTGLPASARMIDDAEVTRLNDAGVAAAAEMDLLPARMYRAGEMVFNVGTDNFDAMAFNPNNPRARGIGNRKAVFSGEMTSELDNEPVVIFDVEGNPILDVPHDLALVRLRKRYPVTDLAHPGEHVFYTRPPQPPRDRAVPCPLGASLCRSRFYDLPQAQSHFRHKHVTTYQHNEEAKGLADRERQTAALEAQAETGKAIKELLARLANGEAVPSSEAMEALAKAQDTVLNIELPPGDVASWSVEQCRAVCTTLGKAPTNTRMTEDAWREHTATALAEMGLA